jgi:trimeric autotransporter adhesin
MMPTLKDLTADDIAFGELVLNPYVQAIGSKGIQALAGIYVALTNPEYKAYITALSKDNGTPQYLEKVIVPAAKKVPHRYALVVSVSRDLLVESLMESEKNSASSAEVKAAAKTILKAMMGKKSSTMAAGPAVASLVPPPKMVAAYGGRKRVYGGAKSRAEQILALILAIGYLARGTAQTAEERRLRDEWLEAREAARLAAESGAPEAVAATPTSESQWGATEYALMGLAAGVGGIALAGPATVAAAGAAAAAKVAAAATSAYGQVATTVITVAGVAKQFAPKTLGDAKVMADIAGEVGGVVSQLADADPAVKLRAAQHEYAVAESERQEALRILGVVRSEMCTYTPVEAEGGRLPMVTPGAVSRAFSAVSFGIYAAKADVGPLPPRENIKALALKNQCEGTPEEGGREAEEGVLSVLQARVDAAAERSRTAKAALTRLAGGNQKEAASAALKAVQDVIGIAASASAKASAKASASASASASAAASAARRGPSAGPAAAGASEPPVPSADPSAPPSARPAAPASRRGGKRKTKRTRAPRRVTKKRVAMYY